MVLLTSVFTPAADIRTPPLQHGCKMFKNCIFYQIWIFHIIIRNTQGDSDEKVTRLVFHFLK